MRLRCLPLRPILHSPYHRVDVETPRLATIGLLNRGWVSAMKATQLLLIETEGTGPYNWLFQPARHALHEMEATYEPSPSGIT